MARLYRHIANQQIAKDQILKRELKQAQKEGAADYKRHEDIYKSMGSAGGISTGLIEQTLDDGRLKEPIDYRVPVDFQKQQK